MMLLSRITFVFFLGLSILAPRMAEAHSATPSYQGNHVATTYDFMVPDEGLSFVGMDKLLQKIAKIECDPQDMTKINVIWRTDKITYDYSRSMAQLGDMPIDTESPYAAHVVTKVGGLMKGGLEVTTNYKISKARYPALKQSCMWMSEIDISIDISPTILIANDYSKGSCMYNAVLEHEMKHIQVDRDVADKYQHQLRDMASLVAQRVGVVGPKSDIDARHAEQKIKDYFGTNMNSVLEAMYAERRQIQQGVDNIHEYERVQKQCKGRR